MKKILVQIKENNIYFKAKKNLNTDQKNIMNTNIISDNELVFTDKYITQNSKIVTTFLNQLVNEGKINTAIISNNSLELELLDILKYIPNIQNLVLKDYIPLTFRMCEKIAQANHIKFVSCFNLQDFMLEYFDKYNIIVEVRCELLFTSKFMEMNMLNKYSSLYYKKIISIDLPLKENDVDDFEAFCTINKYLKVIHLNKSIKSDLEQILETLKLYRKKNIKIVLHDNITDLELIEYIKKINNSAKKSNNIRFVISYSDKYIKENFLRQTNINILKLCLLIIIIIISGCFGYVFFDNYLTYEKVNHIKEDLQKVIEITDTEPIIKKLETESNSKVINEYIASLITVNDDTVGWLKIKNTEIDYPTVQGKDNKYYLTQDFRKKKSLSGWVFMDARNKKDMSDDNTIIYGHNRYESAVMFGTLKNIRNKDWLEKKDNHIINFDTLYGDFKYQIFSYYTIPPVEDYLRIIYENDLDRLEFYKMIQERSEHNFEVTLSNEDKIITLSTCENGGFKRFVVHAKLIS